MTRRAFRSNAPAYRGGYSADKIISTRRPHPGPAFKPANPATTDEGRLSRGDFFLNLHNLDIGAAVKVLLRADDLNERDADFVDDMRIVVREARRYHTRPKTRTKQRAWLYRLMRERGLIDRRPLNYRLEREIEAERPLSFPGKVLADRDPDRLFVADSNHNRIVVASLDGQVLETVGTGDKGFKDGAFDEASFHDPQGMALDGDTLYVADTKNHAVRRVDLHQKRVETVAGIGEQSTTFH